jgi:hypothetical protein
VLGKDCAVYPVKATDLNGDGYKELVFSISTGWSAYPRKIYALDVHYDSIWTTPESCATMINPIAYDVDQNGFDEFIPECSAFKNCDSLQQYNDNRAWLMLFDRNLQFVFKPIGMGKYMSIVKVRPIILGNKTLLVVLLTHCGTDSIGNHLFLYSIEGKLLKEKNLGDYQNLIDACLINTNESDMNNVYLLYRDGRIDRIDTGLNIIEKVQIEGVTGPFDERIDIDSDGLDEFLFVNIPSRQLILTRNDFMDPVTMNIPFLNIDLPSYVSVIKSGEKNQRLYFQSGVNSYIFEYYRNPYYPLKYPLFAGIFLILYALFFMIHRIQMIRARYQFETQHKIAELQLRSIKGQTDPHFTLNLLNSLGTLFDRQDKEKAGYIFGKYATLLRTTILSSDDIESTLATEIEYVKSYLDLEKFRYNDKFDYRITTGQNVNMHIPIPKMLIHTFAENAVKHGIRHLIGGGLIEIEVKQEDTHYRICIKDNGIGRGKATEDEGSGTGRGLKILDDIVSLYYDLKKVRITYEISDLCGENQQAAGTFVTIKVPIVKTI